LSLEGMKVLDLGCGTGRDVYIASKLVTEKGSAFGIDMTDSQISVAKKHLPGMMKKFGYQGPNADFIHDEIEAIDRHFPEKSLDIIISNCVINLLQDKSSVLKKIYNILKYGGEFYFSDIYADRRLPEEVQNNPLLHGECLGGALYTNDFIRMARNAGFSDPREISSHEINIDKPEIKNLTGNAKFYSITYRLWKLENLEDRCEDYGHIAVYKGGLEESPFSFALDGGHIFEKNKPERVCGNTALMVSKTRFSKYFQIIGTFDEHFGDFDSCSTSAASDEGGSSSVSGCGC
ncbi:MAG: methyltransferase domain-containing protein, partial [Spirochaetia bacterium]|nr:methyltransferase domain-containing protein [Spirochaetia bacterium]